MHYQQCKQKPNQANEVHASWADRRKVSWGSCNAPDALRPRDEGFFFFLRKKDLGMREWARSHFWTIIEKPTERKIRLHSKEWNRRTLVIHQELEELLQKKGKDRYHISEKAKYSLHLRPPAKGKGKGVAVKGSLFSSFWWSWALKNRLNHKIPK